MMQNNMKIYGIIGYPVKHSFSPAMHNAAFSALKINAEYKLFELRPQELEGFIKSLPGNNIYGLNVTIPYKEKVVPFLDKISSESRLIGAVNTIKVSGAKLEGLNTDGAGFLKHLSEDLRFDPQGKNIAIIGAGGAAKAISVYLSKAGVRKISLYDLDEAKLNTLISNLRENFDNIDFNSAGSMEALGIQNADLLINATPTGMKESDPCIVSEDFIHKGLLVYDLIYNPQETKLLKAAKQKGARVSNGLGMLLCQGMLSFEIWTGEKAPKEAMQQALLKNL